MKYKVGDKVRIKPLCWYEENKDEDGYFYLLDGGCFVHEMSKYCGMIATIDDVDDENDQYYIDIDSGKWVWIDEFFDDPLYIYEVLFSLNDGDRFKTGSIHRTMRGAYKALRNLLEKEYECWRISTECRCCRRGNMTHPFRNLSYKIIKEEIK